jgi:hypothetical protein
MEADSQLIKRVGYSSNYQYTESTTLSITNPGSRRFRALFPNILQIANPQSATFAEGPQILKN